jgi:hypothetical protein
MKFKKAGAHSLKRPLLVYILKAFGSLGLTSNRIWCSYEPLLSTKKAAFTDSFFHNSL